MPAVIPVTIPLPLTVATDVGAQLHAPPARELLSVIVLPAHTGILPAIGPGTGFTVTITVAAPQVVMYDIVAVPAATAVTIPEELIVATEVGAQLHVPPGNELLNEIVPPGHSGVFPVIAPGNGMTVTTTVNVPQAVV